MRQDFSWKRSAQAYADLYRALTGAPATALPPTIVAQAQPLEKLTA
jgi:hypothetical protein